jgi:hypothetical protein
MRSSQNDQQRSGLGILLMGGVLLLCGAYFLFRGELVTVPNAYVGKVKASSGFQEGLKGPSIFRLPTNLFGMNPTKLVIAEVSDNKVSEDVQNLFMPTDKLNLTFQIIGTFAVSSEEEKIGQIYDRLPPTAVKGTDNVMAISFQQVYSTYGQQAVRTIAQEVVAKYSISQVLGNLDQVSQEIQTRVNQRLAPTPLSIKYCGLGTVVPPQLIIDAQEKAKKRQIEIETATAQKLVNLTKADAAYQVGLMRQQIELTEAETQGMINLVLSDSISPAYVAQRALKVLDSFASDSDVTFLLSTKVFEDPASLLGLSRANLGALPQDEESRVKRLQEILQRLEESKQNAQRQADAVPPAELQSERLQQPKEAK